MYNKIFLLITVLFLGAQARALEVVYPKSNCLTINAASTFFIGNAKGDKSFQINGEDVELGDDGAFIKVVPLNTGENKFVLKSKASAGSETALEYTIIRPVTLPVEPQSLSTLCEFCGEYIYALTVKNNIPLRLSDNENAKRVAHLDKGTALLIDAKKGDYYRVFVNSGQKYWIRKDYVAEVARVNEPLWATLGVIEHKSDEKSDIYKFNLNFPSAFSVVETQAGLEFKLFQAANAPAAVPKTLPCPIFNDNILTFNIPLTPLWGYDCWHEGNNIVLKINKQPKIDPKKPLKGVTIVLDAGHGGCDGGAVGPTGVREADLVLDIVLKTEKILKDEGANVVLTRNCNVNTDLYERVEIARRAEPAFLISVHANALPDGLNPYTKYGTSVFYYNNQSKKLADTLKNQIIGDLGMKDDGTNYASFVLTRPTFAKSVLIEVGYMINPEDYKKLLDPNFRTRVAQSIADGLRNYLCDFCTRICEQ